MSGTRRPPEPRSEGQSYPDARIHPAEAATAPTTPTPPPDETSRLTRGFRNCDNCRLRMLLIAGGLTTLTHTQL
ncbi:hypothetical protein [Dermatophilus congolensis]|uniref:hypothetical protein n=1 Tax=Dermatophilus congolensis TaxID=1863 RepID=UPI001AAF5BCA|nr:hypothetical protein [Dermatophilus congolensis]MBO3142836.1 hypothetical protein [Dermatophilus congolensis]MBO3151829.1 hypothetical protein [Dermatophilus congolensis]MBO3161168.1 hypothetical protein [Dermatophilus congolensis]MBO3163111.1 hypothetical protein [Dermatophilus congolensis]MBO3176665.1 hypothetical protein [Dermatophilus congolensis]